MIAILLGLIGFFVSSGDTLGSNLINALEWMNIWFWIIAIMTCFIYAIIFFTTTSSILGKHTLTNNITGRTISAFFGLGASSIFVAVMSLRIGILIWLSNYLINDINPSITSLNLLSDKQIVASSIILFILVILRIKFSKTTTSKKRFKQ